MTNPTPHGQVPEALPAIQRFEVVDCIDSKHVPAVIPKPHGPWVRYEDHAAEQEEAAQRLRKTLDIDPGDVNDPLHPRYIAGFKSGHAAGRRRAAPAASPTPPAEQAAPKAAPATQPAPAPLSDAVEHYLEAQDALDNREYGGINAEPYEKLLRRRNESRNDLDAALAAQGGKV